MISRLPMLITLKTISSNVLKKFLGKFTSSFPMVIPETSIEAKYVFSSDYYEYIHVVLWRAR